MCHLQKLISTGRKEDGIMHKILITWNSIYGEPLKTFINIKRQLGFKYATGSVILSLLDRMADKRNERSPGITKAFADCWCKKMPNESMRYHYDRVRHLAQFSLYLCDLGIPSFVPKLPPFPTTTFIPYIYSKEQLCDIFRTSDDLRSRAVQMKSALISIPALIRFLYATGLRINEALNLQDDDINLRESFLKVKDSKNNKERVIPISSSLVAVLKQYNTYKSKLPVLKSGYFFVNLVGKKCSYGSVKRWFKECLLGAGIKCVGRSGLPRIHDLRHTFAVTSLASMAEAGVDLYASLPILSTYLGHQSLGATNHYVRLTSNMYPDLIKDVDTICLDVFPKLHFYEAD
jgi:integrase/recombinase XerD